MENIVTVSLEKYEELVEDLIDTQYKKQELYEKYEAIKKEKEKLRKTLLESCVNEYNIRRYDLDEITDIYDYNFGLNCKKQLIQDFTLDELTDFIKKKKQEFEGDE